MRTRLIAIVLAALIAAAAPARADEDASVLGAPWGAPADQRIVYPGGYYDIAAADVGDVNGDGLDDFAAQISTGGGYVTFSRREGGTIDAATGGFTVDGGGYWGAIAGLGDVNGDGLADIAIRTDDGAVVVFGKRDHAPVDIANIGNGGFTISGAWSGSYHHGYPVRHNDELSAPGDLNGDGVPDLVIASGSLNVVVYPPPDAAGTTIDAQDPDPRSDC